MEITYTINKKQGRYRPELKVNITLEKWELALNPAKVSTKIISCDHNYNEDPCNSDADLEKNNIFATEIVTHQSKYTHETSIFLPYRPGKNPQYPEVEAALNELREKFEAAVLEAYNSLSFERTGTIGPSEAYKKKIAPWVAKQKMMK